MALNDLLELLTPYITRLCTPIAPGDAPDAVREAVRVARRAARETPVERFDDVPEAAVAELASDVRDGLRRMAPEHRAGAG